MRAALFFLVLVLASSAGAQELAPNQPSPELAPSEPAAAPPDVHYIADGQDEPGYRSWYLAAPAHAVGVKAFDDYLLAWSVEGIVPTWQLLRTATDWRKCGAQPFEVPPAEDWPNIVQTLRFIRDEVIPAVGPVEPVSVYRNPELNRCAGGAPESAHRYMAAVDLVPLRPTTREALMGELCAVHAADGERYGVGLGFYAFLRFHIDSTRFRKWGIEDIPEAKPCLSEPSDKPALQPGSVAAAPPAPASPPQPSLSQIGAATGTAPAAQPLPPAADPLGPLQDSSSAPKH